MNGNGNVNVARLERVRRVAFGNVVARVTRVRGISLFGSHTGGKKNVIYSEKICFIFIYRS